jgi:hypothetical protein
MERVTYADGAKTTTADRQSNQTLLIPKKRKTFPDSDSIILTDRNGHRYVRNIDLETYIESDYYIFEII